MTSDEANALVHWVKDHDTRFEATAKTDHEGSYVLLIHGEERTQFAPVRQIEEYSARYIDTAETGPTIREHWQRWLPELRGGRHGPLPINVARGAARLASDPK
jgi:hypothetical protein